MTIKAKDFYFYNETLRQIGFDGANIDKIPIPIDGYNVSLLLNELKEGTIWGQYLVNCIKTWNQQSSPLYQIPNATLGLLGEITEYMETPTLDEFGDVLYYRTILYWLLGDEIKIFPTMESDSLDFHKFTLLISDFTKKAVYHNKMHDEKTMRKYHKAALMLDSYLWFELTSRHNLTTFESVFNQNIEKLNQRHTKGFNPNHDNNV